MQSLFDTGALAPCPVPFNLAQYVLSEGLKCPEKTALSIVSPTTHKDWNYSALTSAILGTATGLLDSGLKPGDILLMRLGNSVDFPIAYLGAIAAGIVPVPTSSQLTEFEVSKILAQLSPAAILRGEGIACPDVDIPTFTAAQYEAWHDLPPAAFNLGDPNRLAYIIYTSGTSGTPRAVGHAHRAIWARQMMMDGWYDLKSDDIVLHAGAFNWTYTLGTGLMDPWTRGATALIPTDGTDPAQLSLLLHQYKASIFAAAPGVYRQILKFPSPDLPDLRHGLAAGEKLSSNLREGWRDRTGTRIYEAYGMSECSTFISGSPSSPCKPGALGGPQHGRRVAILDETGTAVPLGTEGVIAVHRSDPGLMLEYIGAPEATQDKFIGDWFLTGDQAMMDEDGQITYLGRNDDMMNAGGYRVSPLEVEAALHGLPGVTELAVTDIAVKTDVRLITAFYTSDVPLDDDVLKEIAGQRLAKYKCPRSFIRIETMPKNPNGKLLRQRLKDSL